MNEASRNIKIKIYQPYDFTRKYFTNSKSFTSFGSDVGFSFSHRLVLAK
jgi:hypothetical protein